MAEDGTFSVVALDIALLRTGAAVGMAARHVTEDDDDVADASLRSAVSGGDDTRNSAVAKDEPAVPKQRVPAWVQQAGMACQPEAAVNRHEHHLRQNVPGPEFAKRVLHELCHQGSPRAVSEPCGELPGRCGHASLDCSIGDGHDDARIS